MSIRKDAGSILGVLFISLVVINTGIQVYKSNDTDLAKTILDSIKGERFAEALGYYSPVTDTDTVTIYEDAPIKSIDVLDNDYDEDPALNQEGIFINSNSQITNITGDSSAVISVNPAPTSTNATATTNPAGNTTKGEVTLDSSNNYNGNLSFVYEVCDRDKAVQTTDINCATETAAATILPVNDLPNTTSFNISTNQGLAYSFNTNTNPNLFAQNFTDPDKTFLDAKPGRVASPQEGYTMQRIRITSLPTKGSLVLDNGTTQTPITLNSNVNAVDINKLKYTPQNGVSGNDVFNWLGDDGYYPPVFADSLDIAPQEVQANTGTDVATQDFSNPSTVNISINAAGAPVLPDQTLTVKRGQTLAFPAINATQVGGTITSVTAGTLPTNTACTQSSTGLNGNIITCAAAINAPLGSQTFTVTATNNSGVTKTANYVVIVQDFVTPVITLISDTPKAQVIINKQVCVTATVNNPNSYDLKDVVALLNSGVTKAPFVSGTSVIVSPANTGTISSTDSQVTFTIPTLPAGANYVFKSCVNPKVTDLNFIDSSTRVTGSDKVSRASVELDPPETIPVTNKLTTTGGIISLKNMIIVIASALLLGGAWLYSKLNSKVKLDRKANKKGTKKN